MSYDSEAAERRYVQLRRYRLAPLKRYNVAARQGAVRVLRSTWVRLIDATFMEREFLKWLADREQGRNVPGLLVDIGDDAAAFQIPAGTDCGDDASPHGVWVATTDAIADGTHFDWIKHDLERIGHKAVAVNLSDLAAMAAIPKFLLVTLQVPELFELNDVQTLYQSIERTAERFQCHVIGGDTNRWPGRLVISITALGTASPGPDGRMHLCLKSGARAGDAIFVTGPLGGSILGRHLDFEPRVELAAELNQRFSIHAMTDISDSLARDLADIAEASMVGFTLHGEQIPVADSACRLAQTCVGKTALDHALYDGEDFELLFTVSAEHVSSIESDERIGHCVHRIGVIDSEPGGRILLADGRVEALVVRGFEH